MSFSFTHSYLLSFFLYLPLTLSVSLFALRFSEWREHQRDQAGLAYWKQMADQRQEGHSFTKRGLNMPGPCRGACPWMMATWCVWVSVCMWVSIWGEMVDFLGYQSEKWDPQITVCLYEYFFSFRYHLCISTQWWSNRLLHQWLFSDLVALCSLTTGVLLPYNRVSKAVPSSLGKVVVSLAISCRHTTTV